VAHHPVEDIDGGVGGTRARILEEASAAVPDRFLAYYGVHPLGHRFFSNEIDLCYAPIRLEDATDVRLSHEARDLANEELDPLSSQTDITGMLGSSATVPRITRVRVKPLPPTPATNTMAILALAVALAGAAAVARAVALAAAAAVAIPLAAAVISVTAVTSVATVP